MKKWIYTLIAVSIIVSPFYVVKSGYPQISDILLFVAFILFIFNYRIKKDKILILIFVITLLISVTNLTWGIIYSNISFILSVGYYVFNFMFLIMIINLYYYHKNEVLEVIYKAVFISVIVQTVISPFVIQTGNTRQTLFFNNPNQLGYYALLSFSIVTLLYYLLRKGTLKYLFFSTMTVYLALLSNSSAAILAISGMLMIQILVMFTVNFNMKQRLLAIFILVGLSIIGQGIWSNISQIGIVENSINRIVTKETTSQDFMYERRYNRVLENTEMLILGAGEGNIRERFGRGEIHSTFISFFFNYGIITSSLLIILFLFLIRKPTLILFVILISIHFYGFTHNGIRQPLFWLAHGIIYLGNSKDDFKFRKITEYLRDDN